jgi:hypothetical protein
MAKWRYSHEPSGYAMPHAVITDPDLPRTVTISAYGTSEDADQSHDKLKEMLEADMGEQSAWCEENCKWAWALEVYLDDPPSTQFQFQSHEDAHRFLLHVLRFPSAW